MALQKFNSPQGFSVGDEGIISYDVIDSNANVSANYLFVSNVSNLGPASNVVITGGSAGYYLKTDGAGNLSWIAPPGGGGIAGSNTQLQFNDNGSFGASSSLTFNKGTNTLSVTNATLTGNITTGNANLGNLVTANYFVGNGYLLSGITGANVTGQVGNSLIAGTVYTNAQPNITSVGLLSTLTVGNTTANTVFGNGTINATGNVTASYFTGNLATGNVSGNLQITTGSNTYVPFLNASKTLTTNSFFTFDPTGNSNQGLLSVNPLGGGLIQASGIYATGFANVNGNLNASNVNITGNIISNNASLGNLTTSNYFQGNGSLLTSITGGNVTGQVGNALVAGTVYTAAQPNITSLGNLTVANVTGNLITGNANLGNLASANYFQGNGYLLTSINGANVSGIAPTANYSTYAGTVTTNAQPNITSVGTLTSLVVTGNITSGNANLGNLAIANFFTGNGSLLTSITGANVTGTVSNANYSTFAGTVLTNSQPNITSVGTLNALSVTGLVNALNTGIKVANIQDGSGTIAIVTKYNNQAGDIGIYGNLTVGTSGSGNVIASYYSGNGYLLSGITGANVTGTVSNANYSTFAGTVTTNAQPNITSVGTLTSLNVTGDSVLTGNLTVTGNFNYINSNITRLEDPVIELGGGVNAAPLTTNDSMDRGLQLHYYTTTAVDAFMGWKNSASEFVFASNATLVNNVTTINSYGNIHSGNATLGNLATASYFSGNGYLLSGITGSNVTGQVSNALLAGTVYTNSQPNITSVGTLTSLSVTGNIISGNANLGNLTNSNYFQGNGYLLTSVNGANVTGIAPTANYSTFAGTVLTNAQPNITSVGTLTSLVVTGNITSGNANLGNLAYANYHQGDGSLLTNITGANVTGQVSNSSIASTVYTNAQPNITSVGTLTTLKVGNSTSNVTVTTSSGNGFLTATGNITANYFIGNIVGNIVGNLSISAGANTQVLFNDGGNANAVSNFTFNKATNLLSITGNIQRDSKNVPTFASSTTAPTNPRMGDEWYDQANDILYKYFFDGTSYYWVDTTSGYISASTSATANTLVQRDANANVTANYFIGNGSQLTGVGSAGTLSNGTSNVNAGTLNGNITVGIAGTANTVIFTSTGVNVANYVTAVGNITGGNLIGAHANGNSNVNIPASNGNITISSAGNANVVVVTGTGVNIAGTLNIGTGNFTAGNIYGVHANGTSNVNIPAINGNVTISAAGNANIAVVTGTGVNIAGTLNVTGVSNLGPNGNVTITGGTSGQYLQTNGSGGLSWATIASGSLSNGTSNVTAGTVNGNITVSVGGTSNTVVFTSTGVNVAGYTNITGNLSVTGNANIGAESNLNFVWGNSTIITNFDSTYTYRMGMSLVPNSRETRIFATGGSSAGDGGNITFYTRSASGSGIGDLGSEKARINTLGLNVSTSTAAISTTTGAIITAGGIGAVGNVYAGGNANVTGNVTGGNLTTGGVVTATGNVTGGNLTTAGIVVSSIATGTAPFTVTSTTRVNNLNVGYANVSDYSNVTLQTTGTFYPTFISSTTAGNYQLASNANINVNIATSAFNAQLLGGTLTTAAQPNITSVGTLTSLNVAGNTTSGNFIGVFANGNSNINIPTSSGNIIVGVGGASNVLTITSSGIVVGQANTYGNIANVNFANANYFVGNGYYLSYLVGSNVQGQVGNATLAGTVYTNAQPNITSVGALTSLAVSGDAVITGNLTVTGNYEYVNSTVLRVQDPVIELGGGANNAALTTNDGFDRGQLLHYYTTTTVDAFMGWKNSASEFVFASNATLAANNVATINTYGNIHSGNANLGNVAVANYFVGNGSLLTGLTSLSVANANYANFAGTVITAAQPNITSLGTLTSANISGNLTVGNISGANAISSNYFLGNGSLLTGLAHATSADSVANGTSNVNIPAINGNISMSVNGSNNVAVITGTGVNVAGTINATGNLVAANATLSGLAVSGVSNLGPVGNVTITGGTSGYVLTTNGSGALSWTNPITDVVAGSNTQVQYNNAGVMGASANFAFNNTSNTLTVDNLVTTANANIGGNGIISGGYLTLNGGIIAVSGGSAGIFTSTITQVNMALAGNVTMGSTTGNTLARGNFTANTITSNTTISGNTITGNNMAANSFYTTRTQISAALNTTTVIDTFPLSLYRTAKYTIRVGSDAGYQSIEALLVHNATDSFITVYGSISTSGSDIVLLSSDVSAGNVELLAISSSTGTTINLIGTYIADT